MTSRTPTDDKRWMGRAGLPGVPSNCSSAPKHLQAIRHVDVSLDGKRVGTLASSGLGTAMFEYTLEWIVRGFSEAGRLNK